MDCVTDRATNTEGESSMLRAFMVCRVFGIQTYGEEKV
jgi:hypothetical protein